MAERRNLIGALGVSIIALGLAALLSYAVALGAQSKRFDWASSIVLSSIAVMVVGSALFVGVLIRFGVLTSHRAAIGRFVSQGQGIVAKFQTQEPLVSIQSELDVWVAAVQTWLDGHMKHYRSHFDNLADARDGLEITAMWATASGGRPPKRDLVDKSLAEEALRKRLLRLKDMMTGWE